MFGAGKISRRQALRGLTAVGATTLFGCAQTNTREKQLASTSSQPSSGSGGTQGGGAASNCLKGRTINGQVLHTQEDPGAGGNPFEHQIQATLYKVTHYAHENASANNVTHVLTVDVGTIPDSGVFHPMDQSDMYAGNRIDCIMVFVETGAACDQLVYWRKFSTQDQSPSTMIVLDPALLGSKLRLVAKCAQHGYWGTDLNLALTTPVEYSTAVNSIDGQLPYGGVSLRRPYCTGAGVATGGQGDIGPVHMPEITVVDNNTVMVTQGDDAAKHPVISATHYVAGAIIYDQNGNPLSTAESIVFGSTDFSQVIFTNLHLFERNVKSIRAVTFDTLNGLLMGFKTL